MSSPLHRGFVVVFALLVVGAGTQATATPMLIDGPPAITEFKGKALSGGQYVFTGGTANCPPGTVITLGGFDEVDGASGIVDDNGLFAIVVEIPAGTSGVVSAVVQPPNGLPSLGGMFFVSR